MPQSEADATQSETGESLPRALLTDREREILTGDRDIDPNYRSSVVAKIRKRFARLERDLEILEDHHLLTDDLPERLRD